MKTTGKIFNNLTGVIVGTMFYFIGCIGFWGVWQQYTYRGIHISDLWLYYISLTLVFIGIAMIWEIMFQRGGE